MTKEDMLKTDNAPALWEGFFICSINMQIVNSSNLLCHKYGKKRNMHNVIDEALNA